MALNRLLVLVAASAALSPLAAAPVIAQKTDWPSRPIRFVVPFPPGGGTDLVARTTAVPLAAALGQQIVIDNRGGAGGNIGVEITTRAEPDGHTILIGSIGPISINPTLYAGKLPFDPLRDLTPVVHTSEVLNMLVVNPALPINSVKEFIEYLRKNPGKVSYGSSGIGATDHLAGELLDRIAGTKTIHVPYKGGGPAVLDLLAGNIQFSFATIASVQQHWKSGKLRGLAVSAGKRVSLFPDLPSMAETLPGYAVNNWYGIFVPAKTPSPIVDRLNGEFNKLLKTADIIERHNAAGIVPTGGTSAEFVKFIKAEASKWSKIIKDAAIKLD